MSISNLNDISLNGVVANLGFFNNMLINENLAFGIGAEVDFENTLVNFDGATVSGLSYGPSASSGQMVYVSKGGSDALGVGGDILNPFLTINHALASITDNSSTKQYCISVDAGTYTENILLKPYISLQGCNPLVSIIDGNIGIDPSFVEGQSSICCFRIEAGHTIDINMDAFTSQGIVVMQECTSFSPITISGNTPNAVFVSNSSPIISTLTVTGGFIQLYNQLIIGATNFIANSTHNLQVWMRSVLFGNTVDVNCFLLAVADVSISGSSFQQLTLSSLGTGTCFIDQLPAFFTNTGFTLSLNNQAAGLAYAPTTPADWSVVPTNVQEALDTLAPQSSNEGDDFTPVISNILGNVNSVNYVGGDYSVCGNCVTFGFTFTIGITVPDGSQFSFEMSIPVPSNTTSGTLMCQLFDDTSGDLSFATSLGGGIGVNGTTLIFQHPPALSTALIISGLVMYKKA